MTYDPSGAGAISRPRTSSRESLALSIDSPAAGPPAFVDDLETCVGCHACVVACANENGLSPGHSWRQVVTFNPDRLPGVPVFHLSVACHHCLEAPCLCQCPARAIRRDGRTGAVLIDDGRCIGCRYCSWVCPYDAPVFDAGQGVMRKCTFCADRLAVGLRPACVAACPVGALGLAAYEAPEIRSDRTSAPSVAGFPDRGTRPSIRFLPLRARATSAPATPSDVAGLAEPDSAYAWNAQAPASPKVSSRTEWSLAVFTFLVQVLAGLAIAQVLGAPGASATMFAALGLLAATVSATHLGRPARAWRAGLNWRRSWLSREVLSFGVFLAIGAVARLPDAWPGWQPLAAVAGLACLFAVDRVYGAIARGRVPPLDGVAALSSGLFLGGVLAGEPPLFLSAGAVRIAAWLAREPAAAGRARDRADGPPAWCPGRRLARPIVGWVLPLGIWLAGPPAALPLAVLAALAGEWLDRCDFYDRLDVLTPRRSMADALQPRTSNLTSNL